MVIDAHTHVFESWPACGSASAGAVRASAAMLLHHMDEAGVAQALLIASPNAENPDNNRYVQAAAAARPDRFKAFVRIWRSPESPDGASPADQLRRLEDAGPVDGATLVLAGSEDWLATAEAANLFRRAAASGRPINLAMRAVGFRTLRKQSRFGDAHILVNEMGNARVILEAGILPYIESIEEIVPLKNVVLKVAGLTRLSLFPWDYPLPDVQALLRILFDQLGADRLCWGSDFPSHDPHLTYRQSLEVIATHFGRASASERAALLGGTLLRVLRPATLTSLP